MKVRIKMIDPEGVDTSIDKAIDKHLKNNLALSLEDKERRKEEYREEIEGLLDRWLVDELSALEIELDTETKTIRICELE